MRRVLATSIAVAALAIAAASPAFAQSGNVVNLMAPPFHDPPPPLVNNEAQARLALGHHGVTQLQRLGRVGDYWASVGVYGGRPVLAYVFVDDGAVQIQPANRDDLRQALASWPQIRGGALVPQTAQAP